MVIRVRDHVQSCDTADQGEVIRNIILPILQSEQDVTLSFDGISTTTTSFVNTAFMEVLTMVTPDVFKRHLRIVKSTRQINEMVGGRVRRYTEALTTH